ncbi:YjgB family protein [Clostridium perfringens]|uniref:YjgB family protein n=1 Tax=Clostridium perfringens TaxID=1502 RepID=UPI0028E10486|nr:YjgB family protein [Clostridium perfringens]MDT9337888.1 YjgB family protein [Clostridium perfringens]MDT9345650.1 YjgB family protein [Clostridium perfringens]MDT9348832.1 YjgB family protein [Clostridium perfringens]MDT9354736.1 YjgB family protein [Clostridium perfringens]
MKKLLVPVLVIIIFALLFVGCTNSSNSSSDSSVEIINSNQQNYNSNNNNNSSNNDTKKSDSNNASHKDKNVSNNKKLDNKTEKLLKDIKEKAIKGEIIDYDFKLGASINDVIDKLGKPSSENYVAEAKGNYFNFDSYNLSFGCNKGDQIFEIRSLNKDLKSLDLNNVENFFGKPDYTVTTKSKEKIIGYKITKDFKILFVFNASTYQLDHYSILYPSITHNSMAGDNGREW